MGPSYRLEEGVIFACGSLNFPLICDTSDDNDDNKDANDGGKGTNGGKCLLCVHSAPHRLTRIISFTFINTPREEVNSMST